MKRLKHQSKKVDLTTKSADVGLKETSNIVLRGYSFQHGGFPSKSKPSGPSERQQLKKTGGRHPILSKARSRKVYNLPRLTEE